MREALSKAGMISLLRLIFVFLWHGNSAILNWAVKLQIADQPGVWFDVIL
jgi:hypothetical protein